MEIDSNSISVKSQHQNHIKQFAGIFCGKKERRSKKKKKKNEKRLENESKKFKFQSKPNEKGM